VLELYQSAKVGTHEEASRSTTVRSIQEVLSSLKDLEPFLEEKSPPLAISQMGSVSCHYCGRYSPRGPIRLPVEAGGKAYSFH
jgi:hypothetical protein